ncbi:MAG TPA: hypothetical protein VHP34_00950 [Alphaproteobacteria bacterium]|jgi:hypothetical protein|nr:hypothetical protein [Alphaproteobacteria bacterium]
MLKTGTFLTTVSAAVLALGMTIVAPQQAAAYENILAPAGPTSSGRAAPAAPSADGMHGGIVSAPPSTGNNPYKGKPADNLYDFVANSADDTPESLEDARRQSADMRKARMQEAQKQNADRVQKQRAEWARMRTEMEKKQQQIMEQARQKGALPYGQQ